MDVDGERFFSDSDVRLLKTIASDMRVALENARLLDELQKRNHEIIEALEQQTATSEILGVIASSPTELQPVLDVIAERAAKICNAEACQIRLVEGDHLVVASNFGDDRQFSVGSIVALSRQSVSGRAVIDREMIHIPDLFEAFEEYPLIVNQAKLTGNEAWLVEPLLREGMAIGTIHIRSYKIRPFTEKQISQFKIFADQAVIAIENVRLFTETQHLLKETEDRAAELAVINSVQDGLVSKLDMQAIYDLVGDKIRDIFDSQGVVIARYEHATETIYFNYHIEMKKRTYAEPIAFTNMTRHLICTRQFVLINEDLEHRVVEFGIYPNPGTSFGKSALWMPLIVGDDVCGVINLVNLDRENAFSESDVRLLQTLANSMSIALENARLWEQEKLYRKALEHEFEIGREIQAGFLPESLPQLNGWDVAASLKSAREVAGDFYDVFELPDGQIGLVIADVCDKGLGAALFMTLFRSLIRAVSNIDFFARIDSIAANSSVARLKNAISLTNNYIAETHGTTGMFATIFFGILNLQPGVLTYINGGHLPPLIINAYGVKEILKSSGPAVGAIADVDYVIKQVMIAEGETLFAYTDGLTDTANPAGEFFSEKDLIPLLMESQSLSPLLLQIQKRVEDYAAGTKQFDDITLLALRRV
jgi:sigma-B regulation protein RsbU (phosphoserine phosphatase)